ncbi:MAG: dihydropteroate synthase [Proteobacteria bacterium]|nr:dihydropteroate synthase [Pseudomonadota bacterium]
MLIIGEKINGTLKGIAAAINQRDAEAITAAVRKQDQAGADVIDVNAGTGKTQAAAEIEDMKWLVEVVQQATAKPLAIDSENSEVIAAGLQLVKGPTPWINSASAAPARLESMLALARSTGGPVIALCMDEKGIPTSMEGRLRAAERIYQAAREKGINPECLYFDPLVMPICANDKAGVMNLELISSIKTRFPGARTVVGLSNISFGLPQREVINHTFLILCLQAGLDAAIMDPTRINTLMSLRASDAILGRDRICRRYMQTYRAISSEKK